MKIAMIGYGKMGQTIEYLAREKGHEIVLKINIDNLHDFTEENLKKADIAFEFSQPSSAFENIMKCLKAGLPVVSGTTAWLEQYDEVVDWCTKNNGTFFYSSNFSLGVNIFFELNQHLAKMMAIYDNYKVDMEEMHHTQKLDAPSGTAVTLVKDIIKHIDRFDTYQLVEDDDQAVEKNCIPVISRRYGNTPGTHTVQYNSFVDSIEIKHTAHRREGFAVGAIMAAQWSIDKKGVFGMGDMLKL